MLCVSICVKSDIVVDKNSILCWNNSLSRFVHREISPLNPCRQQEFSAFCPLLFHKILAPRNGIVGAAGTRNFKCGGFLAAVLILKRPRARWAEPGRRRSLARDCRRMARTPLYTLYAAQRLRSVQMVHRVFRRSRWYAFFFSTMSCHCVHE